MQERASGVSLGDDWADFVRRVREARWKLGGSTGHGPLPRTAAVEPILGFLRRAFA